MFYKRLGEMLVSSGVITEEQLKKAIEIQNTGYDSAAEKASDAPETAKKTTERTSSPVRRTTPLKTTSTSTKKD